MNLDVIKIFKAEKLKITALTSRGTEDRTNFFEAMFNPSQYSMTKQIKWNTPGVQAPAPKGGGISAPSAGAQPRVEPTFGGFEYGDFSVKLILDGTGATDFGMTTGFGLNVPKVKDKVEKFLNVCHFVQESTHEPNKVSLKWGEFQFKGRLERVTINYTLFDKSGNALRAELDVTFKVDPDNVKLSSPDLTHTREVVEGDTLPLLSKKIYGTSRHYLFIAEANNLDDFRNLKTGMKLYFPPLDKAI